MPPTFFRTAAGFRRWLERHHATAHSLLVGFHKRRTGIPGITWPESVDQALCFGWVDGVRKRIDDASYSIRFSPRRARSTWSSVNVRRARALMARGLMRPAGREAFEARSPNRSGIYSYEQRGLDLPGPYDRLLRRHRLAWRFWRSQPPYYRRAVTWWVVSAKREGTRLRRLETLIACSAKGERLPQMIPRRGAAR